MVVPKTPKSSTLARPLKTPKASRGIAKATKRPGENGKSSEKKKRVKITDDAKTTDKKKAPKVAKATKSSKPTKAAATPPQHVSIVDNIDPKLLFGQTTKIKKFNQLQLQLMRENADSKGMFHYTSNNEADLEPLTEMQLAWLEETNPANKLKIAQKATRYCQLDVESHFGNKVKQLKIMQGITGRDTLGMNTVHAERLYRAHNDALAAKVTQVTSDQAREHLVEDYMAGYTKSGENLPSNAWKECNKVDSVWANDNEAASLVEVATGLYKNKANDWGVA